MKRFVISPTCHLIFSRLIGCALVLFLCASVPAFAQEATYVFTDGTGPLSEETFAALDSRAAEISETYDFGVYLAVVNNYEDYDFDDVYDCALAFYQEYDLGHGDGRDGELLFMSMENRRFATVYHGYGDVAFTEYGRDLVQDAFLSEFRDDDWYDGFSEYLEQSAYVLSVAASGTPLGWAEYGAEHPNDADESDEGLDLFSIVIIVVVSGAVAGLICAGLMATMKSVRPAVQAKAYVVPGSLKLRGKADRFTHTTESRVKVKSESDSDSGSSGGGVSHHSGGGYSGRSGGF